ncbi:MAG: alginate export family protein [Planctomycetota bacterium]
MNCLSPRRLRLAFALIVPALAMADGVTADDHISTSGLTDTVVQSVAFDDEASDVIDLSQPVAETEAAVTEETVSPVEATPSMIQPVVSYSEIAPVACNCPCPPTKCCTKDDKAAATAAMKSAYAGLFYANNFSYLTDPCYDGPSFCGEPLKDIKTDFGTWSFGGETRFRYHNERNHRGVGITGRDDNFWLYRQRLYADWKLNDCLRVYAEGLHAESYGETFNPRPIEENDFDIQNLFVDVKLLDEDCGKLVARVGRQELLYGAQRTVSPLDWANTRRTFEGVRLLYQNNDTSLDAFWTEFVPVDPDDADESDNNRQFYGTYLTQKNTAVGQVEGYYLGFDNTTTNFSYHTVGSRVSCKTDSGMLYDFEGAFQFGDNTTSEDHSAGFFTLGVGRKIETDFLSPLVWFYYDYASGEDDFGDVGRGDGGFDHLFPLAHKYNGFMDLFGRRNLHDINVFTATPLGSKVTMIFWYHYFLLVEDTTPYSVVMTPYNTASAAGDRELGHEFDVLFNINLDPRNNILLGYSHFAAGDYYDTTANLPTGVDTDADADFFYAQFQTRY